VHTRHTPLHDDVRLDALASKTPGMSGADLANLVNEAALHAARCGLDALTSACFDAALMRIQLGVRRQLVMGEEERRIIATHESGHALVAYYLPEADTVNQISILPHGQHIGVTQLITEKERYRCSREMLMARVAVALAGRVAEELTFGLDRITTGAEDDLQTATALARNMVMHWGMGKQTGMVFADSAIATAIDREVRDILDEGRATAHEILSEHADQLATLAAILLERECLNRAQFEEVLYGSAVPHGG
jgi:cell division protease FtsH